MLMFGLLWYAQFCTDVTMAWLVIISNICASWQNG